MTVAREAIQSGVACWQALERFGGLDPRYDAGVVEDLLKALNLDAAIALEEHLQTGHISVERFIEAFFSATAPYASMMKELLAFFEAARATVSSSGVLRIAFDFGTKINGLDFDLDSFQVWERKFVEGKDLVTRDEPAWNHDYLLQLCRILEGAAAPGPVAFPRSVADWLATYEGTQSWPPEIVKPSVLALGARAEQLNVAWNVWCRVVRASRLRGISRSDLLAFQWQPGVTGGEDPWVLRLLDGANWAGRMLRALYAIAPDAAAVQPISDTIRELTQSMPRRTTTIDRQIEEFESFLSLPVWQRRHDLYSAWVGARIAAEVPGQTRVHSSNGVIRYSFKGSHLATFERTADPLYLWAELRSPFATPKGKGRVGSIQPDYSVQREPITYPESSVLVVECKQYMKASRKAFAAALSDYARGRPAAQVILVNYGPADLSLLDDVGADVRSRTSVIGHCRPGSTESLTRFSDLIRGTISQQTKIQTDKMRTTSTAGDARARVILTWPAAPRDLDLHAWVQFEPGLWIEVSYRDGGCLDAHPWSQLDRDCQQAPGSETLTFVRPCRIRCAVHNYSSETDLAASGAELRIETADAAVVVKCPDHGTGSWWNVFEGELPGPRIRIINTLQEDVEHLATGESDAKGLL